MRRLPGLAPLAALALVVVLSIAGSFTVPPRLASAVETLRVNLQPTPTTSTRRSPTTRSPGGRSYSTCVSSSTTRTAAGSGASRLMPEAAATLPKVFEGRRTVYVPGAAATLPLQHGSAAVRRAVPGSSRCPRPEPEDEGDQRHGLPLRRRRCLDYSAGKAKTVPGIVVQGNNLTFKLTRPAPDFLSRIAMPFFCALPLKTPIDSHGLQGTVPGAGPYYLKSWTPKQQFVLARNPNYKGPRPHRFDSMVFTVGKSPDASLLEVKAGQADGWRAMDSVSSACGQLWNQYGPGKEDQRLFVNPTLAVDYLALNTSRPTFAKESLRQAVATVIDRGALLDQLGAHHGIPHSRCPDGAGLQAA